MTSKVIIALAAIAGLIGGWLLYKNHIRLPLGIERDLTVLFFFACGWLCKGALNDPRLLLKEDNSTMATSCQVSYSGDDKKESETNWKKDIILAVATIVAFVAYAYLEVPDPNFSIMNNDLGKDLRIFVASSFFGIAGLIGAFVLADKLPPVTPVRIAKGILRNISRNALIILAVHWWILLVLRIIFKKEMDRPGIAYLSALIVTAGVIVAIPIFRCKLYKLLGKEKVSIRESLRIRD